LRKKSNIVEGLYQRAGRRRTKRALRARPARRIVIVKGNSRAQMQQRRTEVRLELGRRAF
jgi:hypothetical protein